MTMQTSKINSFVCVAGAWVNILLFSVFGKIEICFKQCAYINLILKCILAYVSHMHEAPMMLQSK